MNEVFLIACSDEKPWVYMHCMLLKTQNRRCFTWRGHMLCQLTLFPTAQGPKWPRVFKAKQLKANIKELKVCKKYVTLGFYLENLWISLLAKCGLVLKNVQNPPSHAMYDERVYIVERRKRPELWIPEKKRHVTLYAMRSFHKQSCVSTVLPNFDFVH
jgi:hypothetical protein